VEAGAAVLAVCAGLQILGESFVGAEGAEVDGLGLLDCRTRAGGGARAVGELVVEPDPDSGLPVLTGYENHGGVTVLGSSARPAGRVQAGVGNGEGGVDGIWTGRIWGTYLHGPVLARNPAVADLLLSWAVGPLEALDDHESEALRSERLAVALGKRDARPRWSGLTGRAARLRRGTVRR
jgi:CobQ-like glutamine amidotransferase family enzyme